MVIDKDEEEIHYNIGGQKDYQYPAAFAELKKTHNTRVEQNMPTHKKQIIGKDANRSQSRQGSQEHREKPQRDESNTQGPPTRATVTGCQFHLNDQCSDLKEIGNEQHNCQGSKIQ